jgi:hypothetical protein
MEQVDREGIFLQKELTDTISKEIGLLLNFGVKPEIRRKIVTNDRKKLHKPNL